MAHYRYLIHENQANSRFGWRSVRDWCFNFFYGEIGGFWLAIDGFDSFCVVLLLEVSVLRSFRSGKLLFGMVFGAVRFDFT